MPGREPLKANISALAIRIAGQAVDIKNSIKGTQTSRQTAVRKNADPKCSQGMARMTVLDGLSQVLHLPRLQSALLQILVWESC